MAPRRENSGGLDVVRSLPKPSPRPRTEPKRPMPRCECGHAHRTHAILAALGGGLGGCRYVSKAGEVCSCERYRPARVSVRRSAPPARKAKSAGPCRNCAHIERYHGPEGCAQCPIVLGCLRYQPPAGKARTKAKPRCRHCAHPYSAHAFPSCLRCEACPGYSPARGARQKRRTPLAAVRRIADALWSKLVHARPGGCEIQQYHKHECKNGLQAMHGIPRTFSATRWLPINGFLGCGGVHKYFTDRPEAWSALLLEAWGLETFRTLWALARSSEKPDMAATVASLRAELARLEA